LTPRVLIIHASTGNGHLSAANAVDLALQELGVETRVIDGLDFAPRAFRTWYGGGYEATVRMKPELWGWLYKISDDPGFAYHVQTLADSAFLNKLEKEILSFRPDVVVCTHSLPQPKVAELREKLPLKMAVVVTDLYPHLMWHRGEPDFFFLPQDWSYTELLKRYPAAEGKCMITGIPVNRAFSHALPRAQAAEAMGLTKAYLVSADDIDIPKSNIVKAAKQTLAKHRRGLRVSREAVERLTEIVGAALIRWIRSAVGLVAHCGRKRLNSRDLKNIAPIAQNVPHVSLHNLGYDHYYTGDVGRGG
jgi:histone H3/H4